MTLDEFHDVTLRNGALSFDGFDPRNNAEVSLAFEQPPRLVSRVGSVTPEGRKWTVSLSLEIQP